MKQRGGFTIVELLIVIVVIATLAAITVVAYGGVRERANASKALAVVNSYEKVLRMYYVDNQKFPSVGGGTYGDGDACLGVAADFDAVAGSYKAGDCLYNATPDSGSGGGDGHYRVAAYAPLMTALSAYAKSLPSGRLADVKMASETWRGVRYTDFYNSKMIRMEWLISGSSADKCGSGASGSAYGGYVWCTRDVDMR